MNLSITFYNDVRHIPNRVHTLVGIYSSVAEMVMGLMTALETTEKESRSETAMQESFLILLLKFFHKFSVMAELSPNVNHFPLYTTDVQNVEHLEYEFYHFEIFHTVFEHSFPLSCNNYK